MPKALTLFNEKNEKMYVSSINYKSDSIYIEISEEMGCSLSEVDLYKLGIDFIMEAEIFLEDEWYLVDSYIESEEGIRVNLRNQWVPIISKTETIGNYTFTIESTTVEEMGYGDGPLDCFESSTCSYDTIKANLDDEYEGVEYLVKVDIHDSKLTELSHALDILIDNRPNTINEEPYLLQGVLFPDYRGIGIANHSSMQIILFPYYNSNEGMIIELSYEEAEGFSEMIKRYCEEKVSLYNSSIFKN